METEMGSDRWGGAEILQKRSPGINWDRTANNCCSSSPSWAPHGFCCVLNRWKAAQPGWFWVITHPQDPRMMQWPIWTGARTGLSWQSWVSPQSQAKLPGVQRCEVSLRAWLRAQRLQLPRKKFQRGLAVFRCGSWNDSLECDRSHCKAEGWHEKSWHQIPALQNKFRENEVSAASDRTRGAQTLQGAVYKVLKEVLKSLLCSKLFTGAFKKTKLSKFLLPESNSTSPSTSAVICLHFYQPEQTELWEFCFICIHTPMLWALSCVCFCCKGGKCFHSKLLWLKKKKI